MIVERIGNRRGLGSSLTGLAIVLSSSVVLAQQQQPEQSSQEQEDVQVAAAAPGAQPAAQPMWNGVRVIRVKHDRIGEFEGLMKELRDAMQGSGQPGFQVWSMELGDLGTYHIVMQFDSFASFGNMESPPMEPTEWANWLNRMGSTIDSHTVAVAQLRPDLSIMPAAAAAQGQQPAQQQPQQQLQPQPQQSQQQSQQQPQQQAQQPSQQQPGELLMLITDTVMAGKTPEYESFIREEIMPALRRGNVQAVVANEMMFGAEARTWVFAVPLPGWQALDRPSPLVDALGADAAQAVMQRGDALVDSSKLEILRYRADLSFQPTP